jgi:glucose/arabinose dehydrogenase
MYRSRLLLCGLISLALLAGCGFTFPGTTEQPPTQSTAARAELTPATDAPSTTADATGVAPTATNGATPSTADTTSAPANLATPKIVLKQIATGLDQPVFVTHAGDDSDRLFVVQKSGAIIVLRNGKPSATPFLDISDRITASGSEQGLLGLAFHPDYKNNGRFFVYYTASNGDDTLARYQLSSDPERADPASGVVLFAQADPAPNHNGGMLAFGPDGYLYVGLGDGGGGGDPWENGQNRAVLLGKLLRLDVDHGDPYAIPPDNPWPSSADARGEVWAYGLRNPWRFSFDRATGDLYIADVGQGQYEEVDVQRAGAGGGQNYGWNVMEGNHCYNSTTCDSSAFVAPVSEYNHDLGCSITGGYVYRGAMFPQLSGIYFFGDYCSGRIWTLRETTPGSWQQEQALQTRLSISSFGEDAAGEVYLTDLQSGDLYQVVAAP